jgi:hypothetical protein
MAHESTLLPADWTVPASLRNRLGTTAGRQRLLEGDGHLVLVLHAPPAADETGRRGRFFWRAPDGAWRAAPKAERVATLNEHVGEYRAVIEELEQAEDIARQARDYFELLDRLTPLTRATRNLYETLQQAREAVRDDRQLIVARDQAYDLARRADLLQAEAQHGLNFAVAWQAEQQADSSYQMAVATHRLNLLVAFFFPIATVMAVFGANLRHGFEGWDQSSAPLPLLAMLAAGLFFGVLLTGFVTRRATRPQRNLHSKSSSSATRRSK